MTDYKKSVNAIAKKAAEDDAAEKERIQGLSDEDVAKELAAKKAAKSGAKKPRVQVTHERMPPSKAPTKK